MSYGLYGLLVCQWRENPVHTEKTGLTAKALERRTRERDIGDERGARAVDPERAHARHRKRTAPHVQLAQARGEGGRHGEAELEGTHLRGEEQAGVLEFVREGQARVA
jgi:hypothetical protein